MSLQSWKEEFYPTAAKEAQGSDRERLEHSIRKWEGARPADLERHGLEKDHGCIQEVDHHAVDFYFDASSCALCVAHQKETCETCPIVKSTKRRCDGIPSPYGEWGTKGDPEPMIDVLKTALAAILPPVSE